MLDVDFLHDVVLNLVAELVDWIHIKLSYLFANLTTLRILSEMGDFEAAQETIIKFTFIRDTILFFV